GRGQRKYIPELPWSLIWISARRRKFLYSPLGLYSMEACPDPTMAPSTTSHLLAPRPPAGVQPLSVWPSKRETHSPARVEPDAIPTRATPSMPSRKSRWNRFMDGEPSNIAGVRPRESAPHRPRSPREPATSPSAAERQPSRTPGVNRDAPPRSRV